MREGQAGVVIGDRQSDRHLTIVHLSELATVLPRHSHRVRALFGHTGVVDDPGVDRPVPFDHRQHPGADGGEDGPVRPGRLGDEVMQRPMRGLDPSRLHARRHRLDTLAIPGQQETGAIRAERRHTVSVAQGRAQ